MAIPISIAIRIQAAGGSFLSWRRSSLRVASFRGGIRVAGAQPHHAFFRRPNERHLESGHDPPSPRLSWPAGRAAGAARRRQLHCSAARRSGVVVDHGRWRRAALPEPRRRFDGQSPIRGGIPVCWPQFNLRGPLPKHGFARTLPWTAEPQADDRRDTAVLVLRDGAATRALWPHAFRARLTVTLAARSLRVALAIDNMGGEPWSFAAALHSYLRVDEATEARLEGLQGANRWDAVRDDRHVEMAPALRLRQRIRQRLRRARPAAAAGPAFGHTRDLAKRELHRDRGLEPGPAARRQARRPARRWLAPHALRRGRPHRRTGAAGSPAPQWQGWQQLRVA